jgi:hypothetical protein
MSFLFEMPEDAARPAASSHLGAYEHAFDFGTGSVERLEAAAPDGLVSLLSEDEVSTTFFELGLVDSEDHEFGVEGGDFGVQFAHHFESVVIGRANRDNRHAWDLSMRETLCRVASGALEIKAVARRGVYRPGKSSASAISLQGTNFILVTGAGGCKDGLSSYGRAAVGSLVHEQRSRGPISNDSVLPQAEFARAVNGKEQRWPSPWASG